MKNVGEASSRNQEFNNEFSRERIIQTVVNNPSPVIFDVGAHHGQSAVYFHELFLEPTIYSFEPDPSSFTVLAEKKLKNNYIFNLAISEKVGEINFFQNKISHTNSIYRVNYNSKDSIFFTKKGNKKNESVFQNFNHQIKVKTTTLDQFCNSNSISHIDLLKIDVQGAEINVLNGAEQILFRTNTCVIEVSLYDYYESTSAIHLIEEILYSKSLKLYSILEISNNPMNGRTDWVELLYKRTI